MRLTSLAVTLSLLAVGLLFVPADNSVNQVDKKPLRVAVICFFQYEQVSGMNKICFYDCLGSTTAITISSVSLCPLNINR